MKTKTFTLITFAILSLCTANAQVGIGTTSPDPSTQLELQSTEKGFLPPRLTTAQRDDNIVNPAEGLLIYNTEVNCLQWYNGTGWFDSCEGGLTPGPLTDCSTSGFIQPFVTADETIVKDVTNPTTGKIWMDRNLGATTAARESDEEWSQGNEYLLFDMGDEAEVPLMHQVSLQDVLDKDHTKMIYVYDFFNMWTLYIELADITKADETQTYPNLLFVHGQLPDSPPDKQFEAEAQPKKKEAWEEMLDFDDELNDGNDFESLDDFDFDENWN